MICRCTTTSSALVGSSAMITFGRRLIAMAVTTRCFIPPLNSCGKRFATPGSRPTLCNNSAVRVSCSRRERPCPWSRNPSAICSRTRLTGLSEFIAPCAIIATPSRRWRRICSSESASRSVPSRTISPPSIRPGALIRRISDSAIVDLPEPDSPTSPSRSPARRVKSTPSTARTAPRGVW
ncbi:MAG: hypothetical protein AVDCRST_MAG88-4336 [uncultured Thermomicrobiales bacterium]|uniref:Uncharacterized protein n=1 Tax=uncultured Thermomicrobiales bacterium TaxID=1645740 RepID=A0A6J4VUA0_9BACT|nr:MAG: hypothetical protein AVDCRST_MAG88-4336 [uncultured Thermomicrobiales bacterium]